VVFRRARFWLFDRSFVGSFDLSMLARPVQAGSQICVDGFELVQHDGRNKGKCCAREALRALASSPLISKGFQAERLERLAELPNALTNHSAECRESGTREQF